MKTILTAEEKKDLYDKIQKETQELVLKLAKEFAWTKKEEDKNWLVLASSMMSGGCNTFEYIISPTAVMVQTDSNDKIRTILDSSYSNYFDYTQLLPLLGLRWCKEVENILDKLDELNSMGYDEDKKKAAAKKEICRLINSLRIKQAAK